MSDARRGLFLLVLLIAATGCGPRAAWSEEDAWHAPPPLDCPPLSQWQEVGGGRIYEVMGEKMARAERLLAEVPCAELCLGAAGELVGRPLAALSGTRPYLVRAVALDATAGGFGAYVLGEQLWVHHRCMGRRSKPMHRQVLVVQLEQKPATVYVTCSMVE